MRFIDVQWLHADRNDPVRLVSEIDGNGNETRKLEFFRNGSVGYASGEASSLGVVLGTVPVPSLDEITASDEFDGVELSRLEFESLWAQHGCT